MVNLESVKVNKEHLHKVTKNIDYNKLIIRYYEKLLNDPSVSSQTIENKIQRIKDCNKFWLLDQYEIQRVKDYKKTNLCKDKFCNNCKKVKQASRMANFMPHIKKKQDKL